VSKIASHLTPRIASKKMSRIAPRLAPYIEPGLAPGIAPYFLLLLNTSQQYLDWVHLEVFLPTLFCVGTCSTQQLFMTTSGLGSFGDMPSHPGWCRHLLSSTSFGGTPSHLSLCSHPLYFEPTHSSMYSLFCSTTQQLSF